MEDRTFTNTFSSGNIFFKAIHKYFPTVYIIIHLIAYLSGTNKILYTW